MRRAMILCLGLLAGGCANESTALDLSPLPLTAATVDAERMTVVASAADPAVRAVIGGTPRTVLLQPAAADAFGSDLTVALPRVRYPGTPIVLPAAVRGQHFAFANRAWTGTPSPAAPPNGISIALHANVFAPDGIPVGTLVIIDSSTTTHAVAAVQVRGASGQLLLEGRLMESLANGSLSAMAALAGSPPSLELLATSASDGRSSGSATLRNRPTAWTSDRNVLRATGEVTLRIGPHTVRQVSFARPDNWTSDSLVYRVDARRIATGFPADTTLRRAHPDARALIAAMLQFLQESPSPEAFTSRVSGLLQVVLPRPTR